MADIIQTFPKGTGSGGGHIILDTDGTAVAQEKNLQFTGLSVTDDSTNEITEVAGEGLNADSIDNIADASSIVPAVIIGDSNNYSTSEKIVGKWIDGKPIYQKTIVFGALPNNDGKSVAHNISNINKIVALYGTANQSDGYTVPIAGVGNTNAVSTNTDTSVALNANKTNVIIRTFYNMSSYIESYITLQYTKTTD